MDRKEVIHTACSIGPRRLRSSGQQGSGRLLKSPHFSSKKPYCRVSYKQRTSRLVFTTSRPAWLHNDNENRNCLSSLRSYVRILGTRSRDRDSRQERLRS